MSTKTVITIDGKEYPCQRTMGATFDFKDITGKDVSKMDPEDVTESLTFMWATIRAACARFDTEFPYATPRDMAMVITEAEVTEFGQLMAEQAQEEVKKKMTTMKTQARPRPSK